MKRVLFISPTPTHFTNAGNRAHIKSLVSFFQENTYDVHFLYLAYEEYDQQAMEKFHGSNLRIVGRDVLFSNTKTPSYILWSLNKRWQKFIRKAQQLSGRISREQHAYNNEVDNYFSVFAGQVIKVIARKEKFDVVVCEYVSMSKSLTYFGKDTFKILDTHDVFTDRFRSYLQNGMKPSWISLFKDQEKKAVKRAHLILAVKDQDKQHFTSLSRVKVLRFNYLPDPVKVLHTGAKKQLLYLASANKDNVASINYFLEQIFPLVLSANPEIKLIIGGNVCSEITKVNLHTVLLGPVDDVQSFYRLGEIVINPEIGGTGYKVKAMEALAHGMPLICTTAGAAGVIEPFEDHLVIADEPADFADAIQRLFEQPELLQALSLNSRKWIMNLRDNSQSRLKQIVTSRT